MTLTAIGVIGVLASVFAEVPHQFRERLMTVHRIDRRDGGARPTADDYVFSNGVQIVVPDSASLLVHQAAADFADYLIVSMRVNASVREKSVRSKPGLTVGVTLSLGSLEKRGYVTTTATNGVMIVASDDRMLAQALYRLEDVVNFRRAPFIKRGIERRFPVFEHRVTFSGFGNDIFPDAHLNQLAHYGFTDIEIWLDATDVISQGQRQDINDLVSRASKCGAADTSSTVPTAISNTPRSADRGGRSLRRSGRRTSWVRGNDILTE